MPVRDFHAKERARGAARGENFTLKPEQARLDILDPARDGSAVQRRDLELGVYLLRGVLTAAGLAAIFGWKSEFLYFQF